MPLISSLLCKNKLVTSFNRNFEQFNSISFSFKQYFLRIDESEISVKWNYQTNPAFGQQSNILKTINKLSNHKNHELDESSILNSELNFETT